QGGFSRGGAHPAEYRAVPRARRASALHLEEPGRLPDTAAGVHRRVRHAGGGFRPPARAVSLDPGSLATGRDGELSHVRPLLRLPSELSALPHERRVARNLAEVPLLRPHAAADPAPAQELDGHHRSVLPALLYVSGQHGALLAVDELVPAHQPGGRATVAAGVNAILWEA